MMNPQIQTEETASFQFELPDRKTFIATLSGGAFVIGVTGATIYSLRKARLQAIKEAKEAVVSRISSSSSSSSSSTSAIATSFVPSHAHLQKSDIELPTTRFGLFKPISSSTTVAPTSVFDESNASLPGVLQRRKPSSSSPSPLSSSVSAPLVSSTTDATNPNIDYTGMDSTLDFFGLSTSQPPEPSPQETEYIPKSFGDTPVGLSVKAFGIATAIVLGSTLVVVGATRKLLGVETMDEFVVKMAHLIPSRQRGELALAGISPSFQVSSHSDEIDPPSFSSSSNDHQQQQQQLSQSKHPLPMDQFLDQLADSPTVSDWFNTLKTQLDAERDQDVLQRYSNHGLDDGSLRNDSISSSSCPPTFISSPLEDFSNSHSFLSSFTFGISPVLPSTAFSVGFVSGMLSAGKKAGLVFMAENAHRIPTTVQGWYFYSKTKNYRVVLAAAKGGLKGGSLLGLWTTTFCLAERLAELTRLGLVEFVQNVRTSSTSSQHKYHHRKQQQHQQPEPATLTTSVLTNSAEQIEQIAAEAAKTATKFLGHWTDGMLAGLSTASIAIVLYRISRPTAMRILRLGVLAGGMIGGFRDVQEHMERRPTGGVASQT